MKPKKIAFQESADKDYFWARIGGNRKIGFIRKWGPKSRPTYSAMIIIPDVADNNVYRYHDIFQKITSLNRAKQTFVKLTNRALKKMAKAYYRA